MLESSARSWNAGDLDGFLDDYWVSDSLTFSGATGVTRGWDDLRSRYLTSYWAPETVRDSLRFESLEVIPLGETHALALGRYVLHRPEEGDRINPSGYFSLVLRQTEGKWKIVHDHTSASQENSGGEG
jgi:ketosteroid isomerase-like protein